MKVKKYGRTWYSQRKEAMEDRKRGDKIYYSAGMKMYYLITPKKKSFWDF